MSQVVELSSHFTGVLLRRIPRALKGVRVLILCLFLATVNASGILDRANGAANGTLQGRL